LPCLELNTVEHNTLRYNYVWSCVDQLSAENVVEIPVMPAPSSEESSANWTVTALLLGLGCLVVVALAIFYRSAGFKVEIPVPGGQSVSFSFEDNRIDLSKLLDQLLSGQAPEGTEESVTKQDLVKDVLRKHGFYPVPSGEAVTAIRKIDPDDENAREFVRDMRRMLYDLAGPFARTATLAEADDDRLLEAFDDLYAEHPANPLVVKLWEMSLQSTGFQGFKTIPAITVQIDRGLSKGVGATCIGSILLDKVSLILAENQIQPVQVLLSKSKPCTATSSADLLKGEGAQIWISQEDMDVMFENPAMRGRSSFTAQIVPFPKHLLNSGPTT
jgi:hypothetical protein